METQNRRHTARDTSPESSEAFAAVGQMADGTSGHEPSEPQDLPAVPEAFRIVESTADGWRVIAPCGELDLANAAQLKARLAGNSDTVLDLSGLSFIDSTGIHVLVGTTQRARSEAWDLAIRNPQPAVLRVIKLLGLTEDLGLESQTAPEAHAEQQSC